MQDTQIALVDSSMLETVNHPLSALVGSLEQIVRCSEDDFLSLGMNLQKVQMLSSSQRKKIAAAMGLFKADDDQGVLKQISSYVQRSQQETLCAQQTATHLCTNLSSMMTLMDSISKKSHILEKAGLFLHVIGINTGIECARHEQMESMFKVVSKDTIFLAEQIRKATETLYEQTSKAKADQQQTLQGAQKSIESLEDLARGSKQATEMALGKVAELIDYSISMVNDAERMAVNITAEINCVVMGIQFHDNLRQRIEHVNDALLETAELAENSSEEVVCNTYLSVELQKAQLDNLIGELGSLFETQTQALAKIIAEVLNLETRLQGMVNEQSADASRGNPVAVLLTGISSLEHLNRDSVTLGEEIQASAEHAEQVVDEMNTAIKGTFSIATNVKINALNAIIKAAKFGRSGESLQVLAQGMVTVSRDTREMVKVFDNLLDQLRGLAHGEVSVETEQDEQTTIDDFDSVQMEQVFLSFREELLITQQDCRGLAESLEKEQQRLVFISNLKEALQQYADLLGDYGASIAPQNEQLLESLRSNFGKQLESRYTMNEERNIHHQISRGGSIAAAATVATATVADDCLFFDEPAAAAPTDDVDLWGDDPVAAETSSASIELFADTPAEPVAAEIELWGDQPAAPTAAVELFDPLPAEAAAPMVDLWDDLATTADSAVTEAEPTTPVVPEENAKEEDFGDNVDLF